MEGFSLDQLTPEQLEQLKQDIKTEEAAKESKLQEDRKELKKMASETVETIFGSIQKLSEHLSEVKTMVFESFSHLIDLKCDLYKVKDTQQSHTFSNEKGNTRVTLGWRTLDRYDETADAGISKVREYMDSLAVDEKTGKLVSIINSLLKRDQKNNLKANRVLELQKLANESDSDLFKDGVKIIMDSYKPERSSYFIEAETKDPKTEKWVNIPLTISAADFVKNNS